MTAIPHAPEADPFKGHHGFFSRYLREISVAAAYAGLLLLIAILRPAFFVAHGSAHSQLTLTMVAAAPMLVAAVGMTLVILARHIDISIGSQFSVCCMVSGWLTMKGVPMPAAVLGTLAVGAFMGAINGALVAGMGFPSIVVTLATMVIIRGELTWITQGAAYKWDASRQWFGLSQSLGQFVIIATAVALFFVFFYALRWTSAGRTFYAVGSDQEAARLAGIRPRRVVFSAFVIMGVLTAVAALLNTTQFLMTYPSDGNGKELAVIAAVVIGGTAITGGRGTIVGTLLGVLLLATVEPVLIYLSARFTWLGAHWAKAIQGTIILLAVATEGLQRRRA